LPSQHQPWLPYPPTAIPGSAISEAPSVQYLSPLCTGTARAEIQRCVARIKSFSFQQVSPASPEHGFGAGRCSCRPVILFELGDGSYMPHPCRLCSLHVRAWDPQLINKSYMYQIIA
jgi:hypothetical protein